MSENSVGANERQRNGYPTLVPDDEDRCDGATGGSGGEFSIGPKLLVALVALGGAVVVAYSMQPATAPDARAAETLEPVVLRETPPPDEATMIRAKAPTAQIRPTLLAPPPEAGGEQQRVQEEYARLAPPPMMARVYPNGPVGLTAAADQAVGIPDPVDEPEIQRMHRVRDGDTLEALAQRYLGDRLRWREIYGVNRELIERPDLLPLGAKLRIPAKYPLPSPPASAASKPIVQAPMVPVE